MRVTLVNPPWQFYNPVKLYPLGLCYLGASLREEGRSQVAMVDLNVEVTGPGGVVQRSLGLVDVTNPDVVGLSCWTVQAPFVVEFVRHYKARHPEVTVVLGGIHASAAAEEMMRLCPADVVVRSEGERTLSEVLAALEQRWGLEGVRGISFRQGENVVTTGARPLIRELDSLPFPAYDMLPPVERYQPLNRKFVFSVTASRGCVHHCAFCSGSGFWRYQRWRSPENVISEIAWLRSRYGAGFIRFEDDDLLSRKPWAERLLNLLRDVPVPFSCLARIDSVQDGIVELLAFAGCKEIYHGLETTSPRLWKLLRKDVAGTVDLARCRDLVAREVALGVIPTVSAMIGIPTETEEEMNATVDFLADLRAMGARTQLWILTPYPDTAIVREFGDKLVQVDRWRRFAQFDVFSEVARDAYGPLIRKYKPMAPDWWMFANEAGVEKTGQLYMRSKGRLMGMFDFV